MVQLIYMHINHQIKFILINYKPLELLHISSCQCLRELALYNIINFLHLLEPFFRNSWLWQKLSIKWKCSRSTLLSILGKQCNLLNESNLKQSVIPGKKFSLYLGDTTDQSVAIIGGSDLNTYSSDPTSAVTLTLNANFFWQDDVDSYSIGQTTTYTTAKKNVIFDSGTSLAYLPSCMLYLSF